LLGLVFVPFQAKANIISDFFATAVSASVEQDNNDKNSQSTSLSLQANVSSSSFILDKKNKNDKEADVVDTNETIKIVSGALSPASNPISNTPGIEDNGDPISDQVSVYVVRKGDSISQIAEMYDVSVNTILWGNDMKKGDKLKEGDTLFILPISGVKHVVTKGQTLKSIAQKYNADVLDIVSFNGITTDTKLEVGEELIIPDGEMSVDGPINTSTKKNTTTPKTSLKNIAGYFINPVSGAIKTQGLHGKNAVDLAAPIGTPIRAAASGTVILARMGWNGAYGNMVIIQHPNGTKTLYSHLSKLSSSTGDSVNQGEIIGYVGNTGRVRAAKGGNGAHLHFEVYNAKNPGADNSWAR